MLNLRLLNVTVGAFLMWHLAIDRHFDFYIKYTTYKTLLVSVSTITYCVVQINCLPLPRFFKK